MTMNVAVPCEKHSGRFGQDASSHTLCSPCARSSRFTRATAGPTGARTRIQGGFLGSGPSAGMTFTGMREVLSRPRISRVGRMPIVVVAVAVIGRFPGRRGSGGHRRSIRARQAPVTGKYPTAAVMP